MSSQAQSGAQSHVLPNIMEVLARSAAIVRSWRDRARQRDQLQRLTDRDLRDIGISRLDAVAESRKPFWRA